MKHQSFSQRNRPALTQQPHPLLPLVTIPQCNINIYSDCICIGSDPHQTIDTINQSNSIKDLQHTTNDTANKFVQQSNCRKTSSLTKIKLNSPDLAFNIKDEQKAIEIFDIIKNSLILKFVVNKNETLLIVKSLLRRKLCQLGFERIYRFIKFLGKGATASVHLVERISDKKLFAAKIISIKDADDKSYETFINQSKLLRILKHRNIINLQSLYVHKKELIQVMQYLNGGTLYHLIINNQVTFKEKWKILRDITNGLQHLRQRSIVHRDIKTENILVRKLADRTQYVISDFGLASWIGQTKPLFEKCGTPGYIAPEILNAPKNAFVLNHKTDIFSLGVIAHLLFLGEPLFCTEDSKYDIKQVLRLNKQSDYNLDDEYYDLPILEKTFLQMTLEKDSQKRATSYDLLLEISFADRDVYETPPKLKSKGNNKKLIDSIKRDWKVEVEYFEKPKIKKHKVSLSLGSKQAEKYERRAKNKEKADYKEERKASSARKFLTEIWDSITKPSPRKQSLKIKDNSIEKQRRLSQYFY